MDDSTGLLLDRPDDLRVAVTHVGHANPGGKVQQPCTFARRHIAALAVNCCCCCCGSLSLLLLSFCCRINDHMFMQQLATTRGEHDEDKLRNQTRHRSARSCYYCCCCCRWYCCHIDPCGFQVLRAQTSKGVKHGLTNLLV